MTCLGGDGVILHASNLFRGAVPPVVSFNLGSLGFLTSHHVSIFYLLHCFFFISLFFFYLFCIFFFFFFEYSLKILGKT